MTCVCRDCNTPRINVAKCVTQACLKSGKTRKNRKCWKWDVWRGLYLKAHIHIQWVRHLLLHEAFTASRGIYCSTPSTSASWDRHVQEWYCKFFFYYFTTQSREINPFRELPASLYNTPHEKGKHFLLWQQWCYGTEGMSHVSLFLSVNRDPIVKCPRMRGFVRLCCVAHFHSDGSSQWYRSRFVTNGTIARGKTGGNGFVLSESGLYSRWTLPHLCLQTIIAAFQGNFFHATRKLSATTSKADYKWNVTTGF